MQRQNQFEAHFGRQTRQIFYDAKAITAEKPLRLSTQPQIVDQFPYMSQSFFFGRIFTGRCPNLWYNHCAICDAKHRFLHSAPNLESAKSAQLLRDFWIRKIVE